MPELTLEVLQDQLKRTESTLAVTAKKNEELEQRLKDMNEKQVQAKVDDLTNQTKAKDEKISSLEAQIKEEQKARTEAQDKLAKANEEATKLKTELDTVRLEKAKATRITQWIEHTGVEQTVATKVVDSLSALNDEQFKNFLETQPAKAKVEEKKKADAGAKNADTKVLDNVTPPEKDATLANAGVDTGVEEARAGLGKLFSPYLRPGNKKKIKKAE